jgi:hypothetical protein
MKKSTKKVQQYAVSKKKPVKQTLKCSTKGFANLKSGTELRNKMFSFYRERLEGKEVLNKKTGIRIQFHRAGARKTTHGGSMYAEKAALITILDKICRQGHLYSLGKAKEQDIAKGVLCFLNFKTNVTVDNKMEVVKFSVRVMKDGTFHYHIDIPIKFENKKSAEFSVRTLK